MVAYHTSANEENNEEMETKNRGSVEVKITPDTTFKGRGKSRDLPL